MCSGNTPSTWWSWTSRGAVPARAHDGVVDLVSSCRPGRGRPTTRGSAARGRRRRRDRRGAVPGANVSRVQSGTKSATPPGRVCANAVPMQARRSSSVARYVIASWTKTASNVRPSRSVRMSPRTCSHSGLSSRLRLSICGERSDERAREAPLRWEALLPPPEPSSSSVYASGTPSRISVPYRSASSRSPPARSGGGTRGRDRRRGASRIIPHAEDDDGGVPCPSSRRAGCGRR